MVQKRTLLFLDDDQEYVEPLTELLQLEGYRTLSAVSIDEARQLLDEKWAHMVVVDLSMTGDPKNRDGLLIVNDPKYAALPKVILTGFGDDPALIRDTLRYTPGAPPPVVDFIGKDNSGIEKALIAAFEANVEINWELQIQWGSRSSTLLMSIGSFVGLAGLVMSDHDRDHLAHRVDELEDLVRQAFKESRHILIGRLLAFEAGVAWLELFAQGAYGTEAQFLVAVGQKEAVHQQKRQFEQFVPQSANVGNLRLAGALETLRFGIALFECIGGSLSEMDSLQNYCLRHPTSDVVHVVNHLFGTILSGWHRQRREIQTVATLKELFLGWGDVDKKELEPAAWARKMESFCNQATPLNGLTRITCSPEELNFYTAEKVLEIGVDPIFFLMDTDAVLNASLVVGTIHNHLHPHTVLVSIASPLAWPIDFSDVRLGPVLKDYIALESALKAELFTMVSIERWCQLEERLLAVNDLRDSVEMDDFSLEVQKLVKAVGAIRAQATVAVTDDLRLYLAALFVHAAAHLLTFDETKKYAPRELAPYLLHLVTAATACQYLTSPRQFEPDFVKTFVMVEGEKKSGLAKQEWKILKYLHDRVGHVCKFEDLLRDVYEDPLDDITNGAWMIDYGRPKVNAAIGRMRKKLEPNSRKPRYILTEREHGYMLKL